MPPIGTIKYWIGTRRMRYSLNMLDPYTLSTTRKLPYYEIFVVLSLNYEPKISNVANVEEGAERSSGGSMRWKFILFSVWVGSQIGVSGPGELFH